MEMWVATLEVEQGRDAERQKYALRQFVIGCFITRGQGKHMSRVVALCLGCMITPDCLNVVRICLLFCITQRKTPMACASLALLQENCLSCSLCCMMTSRYDGHEAFITLTQTCYAGQVWLLSGPSFGRCSWVWWIEWACGSASKT